MNEACIWNESHDFIGEYIINLDVLSMRSIIKDDANIGCINK